MPLIVQYCSFFLYYYHEQSLLFDLFNRALYFLSSPNEIKNIMILNILGEVVFKTSTYEDFVIPNILNSGIYIVKIKQGGKQGLSRLVVP